jgi:hypothetical protein
VNLPQTYPDCQSDYQSLFIQRQPSYAVKLPGRSWRTKNKPLADPAILAHLNGTYDVAGIAQWYPQFGALDLDRVPFDCVLSIRDELGMNDSNSMIYNSESADSHHIFFRPKYNDRPPTIKLLNASLQGFCASRGIEVYPQKSHAFRLPFGINQRPIFSDGGTLDTLEEKMYWFAKLDDFDLGAIPRHQGQLDLFTPQTIIGSKRIGYELLEHGLQGFGSRNHAQFEILLSLYRDNVAIDAAVDTVWKWIQKKHNGFSRSILYHPRAVAAEIRRQAAIIYGKYDLSKTFPDTTHNTTNGYISKPDLLDCIEISGGSLPRLKFLADLIRYSNSRRHRPAIQIHTDKLIEWSSHHTYQKRIAELEGKGIIERSTGYQAGVQSKTIKLNWKWRSSSEAVLHEGRSSHPYGTIKQCMNPEEFRDRLRAVGVKRTTAIEAVKSVF